MARNVILRVCDGDPACDRAREFVTRMAAELGLELDVRSLDPSSGVPVPQVVLWDGTAFDRVADEGAAATLRDAIRAKIWSEDATSGAGGVERDAQFAREEGRGSGPPLRTPVLLRGGRRRRRDLAARLARKVREGGVPVVLVAVLAVAAVALGSRDSPEEDPGPRTAVSLEAPPLDLPTLDGFRFDLARERGRAVLLVPFDARKPNRDGLLALAAEAEKALELSRGDTRVVAIGVGLGVAELRAALRELPFALTVAADADGRATGAFASAAGQGAGWWLVDRSGRVVGRGGRLGSDAFAALNAHARGAGAR